MSAKKILLTRIYPKVASDLLEENGFLVTKWDKERPMTSKELIENSKGHDAILCTLTDTIKEQFFKECTTVKMVSQFAVGYDNIAISEATRLGIPVGYTPDAVSEPTADIAFGLMIATARKMFYLHKSILKGEWGYFKPNSDLGLTLKNKTLGIFGLGRIGIETAKLCKGAYNMDIIYHNRSRNKQAEAELGATYVDFNTLLSQSDIVSVHCALTPETKELFNKEVFSKMKSTAIFINTARGLVHNETDLIEALQKGEIWGAGLDVTNPEPMQTENPLLQMENVTVLPHVGSGTIDARDEMSRMSATNIIEFFKNRAVPYIVNPEVLQ